MAQDHRRRAEEIAHGFLTDDPAFLKEILGMEVAVTESEATYQEMFRSLKKRGSREWSW